VEINWKRNTALFLTGQALSQFGTMVVQYAILWHITLKSQSGTIMTLFVIVGFLPMFFISPFAGVWADKFNRKYIINIADGTIAFFSLIVTIFLIFGIDNYGILLICAFIRSVGQGVQTPAIGAFIPQIVPEEHLIIIITAICTFLITPASLLTPLQVTRNFGADVWRLTAMEIIFSVGMMAGGILIGIWGGLKNRIYTMALCCVLCGLLSAGLGLAPFFVPYLVIIALIGLVLPMYNAPAMVLLQTNVEPAFIL
jgi:DHA3 family macrolide efflux protein-like MFS transporter